MLPLLAPWLAAPWLAPEQVRGTHVDGRGDQYALGVILYQMLTGRPPFRAATPLDTVLQVLSEEPVPPTHLNGRLSRDMETICLKCLRKEPARRYASAAELADDLARFQQGRPIHARPVSYPMRAWRWCRRQPLLAALTTACVVLAATLLAAGGWFASRMAETRSAIASAEVEVEEAREVAATQEYFALLHTNRERASRREPGWPGAGLADLQKLFRQGEPGVDLLRVTDLERKLLITQGGYLDILWELSQARADLAAAVGDPTLMDDCRTPPADAGGSLPATARIDGTIR